MKILKFFLYILIASENKNLDIALQNLTPMITGWYHGTGFVISPRNFEFGLGINLGNAEYTNPFNGDRYKKTFSWYAFFEIGIWEGWTFSNIFAHVGRMSLILRGNPHLESYPDATGNPTQLGWGFKITLLKPKYPYAPVFSFYHLYARQSRIEYETETYYFHYDIEDNVFGWIITELFAVRKWKIMPSISFGFDKGVVRYLEYTKPVEKIPGEIWYRKTKFFTGAGLEVANLNFEWIRLGLGIRHREGKTVFSIYLKGRKIYF